MCLSIGNHAAFICPSAKDNVLALGCMTQFSTIVTTFRSLGNTFRISYGATTFTVPMASDSICCITKDHVKLLLTHVNVVTLNNTVKLTTTFTKEHLARADEVRRLFRRFFPQESDAPNNEDFHFCVLDHLSPFATEFGWWIRNITKINSSL